MHQLPFDAQITEKLFHIVQDMSARDHRLTSDNVPSFVWAPQSFAVPGKAGWVLAWLPSRDTQPERVFSVDGVSFYIPPDVEPLLRGKVFDWDDQNGVVLHAA